jgi:hypothetical protein
MSCYGQDKGVCMNLANAWRASPALILDWLGISMDKKSTKTIFMYDKNMRMHYALKRYQLYTIQSFQTLRLITHNPHN